MVSSHIRKTKSFRSAQKMTVADWIGIWQRDYLLNVKQSTLNLWLRGKNPIPKNIQNKNIKSIE